MSQLSDPANELSSAYELLRHVVFDLCRDDYVPSAAAVKSRILVESPAFTERALGFKRFVDFLDAAVRARVVSMTRDPLGHPRLFPISYSADKVQASIKQPSRVSSGVRRLKRSVWRAFVNWEPRDYFRYWDRSRGHAVLSPAIGQPPWELEPERFREISAIPRELQVEWMRGFGEGRPAAERARLLTAVAPESRLGDFRRALSETGLGEAWKLALESHVNAHCEEWARAVGIGASRLFEGPTRPDMSESTITAAAGAEQGPVTPNSAYRKALHAVIDRMTVDELNGLLIPAKYLNPE